ncbi:MAG: hypothetical protein AB7G06_07675 [Bdellovibrionales bacterium]
MTMTSGVGGQGPTTASPSADKVAEQIAKNPFTLPEGTFSPNAEFSFNASGLNLSWKDFFGWMVPDFRITLSAGATAQPPVVLTASAMLISEETVRHWREERRVEAGVAQRAAERAAAEKAAAPAKPSDPAAKQPYEVSLFPFFRDSIRELFADSIGKNRLGAHISKASDSLMKFGIRGVADAEMLIYPDGASHYCRLTLNPGTYDQQLIRYRINRTNDAKDYTAWVEDTDDGSPGRPILSVLRDYFDYDLARASAEAEKVTPDPATAGKPRLVSASGETVAPL